MSYSTLSRSALRIASVVLLGALPLTVAPAQDWQIDAEMTQAELDQRLSQLGGESLYPVYLSARDTGSGARYTGIWQSNGASALWQVFRDQDEATFQATFSAQVGLGYRALSVDVVGAVPNERYTSVWLQTGGTSGGDVVVTRRSLAQVGPTVAFQQGQGRELVEVGAAGTSLCLLFGTGSTAPSTTVFASSDYGTWLADRTAAGEVVVSTATLTTPNGPLFAGVAETWSDPVDTSYGVGSRELAPLLRWMLARNFIPWAIDAWDDAGEIRFNVSWELFQAAGDFLPTGVSTPEMASVDAMMETFMRSFDVPHAIVAITYQGRLVHNRGYNLNSPGSLAAEPKSEGRIGSVSKPLTAMAILKLAEQGAFSIDDAVGSVIDVTAFAAPEAGTMTIRQLLSHTSGMASHALIGNDDLIATTIGGTLPVTADDWAEYIGMQSFPGPVGVYNYSNAGYCLLGRIVEAASGVSYERYVRENLLGPAGAGRMRIGRPALEDQSVVEIPYVDPMTYGTSVLGDGQTRPWVYGGLNIPAADSVGGWVSSAEALARVLVDLDDPANSRMLSQASITEMWTPQVTINGNTSYGLGWDIDGNTGVRSHTGSLAGTNCQFIKLTDDINIVAILGRNNGGSNLSSNLRNTVSAITNWPAHDLFRRTAALTVTGSGCGATVVRPSIRLAPGSLPIVGDSVHLVASYPAASASGVLIFGAMPSPLNLALLGAPSCTVVPSLNIITPVPIALDQQIALAIPDNPVLVGNALHFQGLGLAPALPVPILLSPGMALLFGT